MPDVFRKQPWEERTFVADFSDTLRSGRVIASIVSVNVDASSPGGMTDLTVGTQSIDGDNTVAIRLAGGTDGESYPVRTRVTDDNGDRLESDDILQVREI